jgi:hypothetical protein
MNGNQLDSIIKLLYTNKENNKVHKEGNGRKLPGKDIIKPDLF